ncbi:MAG: ATP synthase subunit delta [bacterium]|nr:MAG: ATP synthase subunit delta [bacterium]
MRGTLVARRYARALMGGIQSEKTLETVSGELSLFASFYAKNAQLRKTLIHPGIPGETKGKILDEISAAAEFSDECRRALSVIMEHGRIGFVGDIARSLVLMADEKLKRIRVEVTSAYKLPDNDLKTLETAFSAITGKTAALEGKTDGSLIGGLVARVGSMVYDGSIRNQLRLLKARMEQEA